VPEARTQIFGPWRADCSSGQMSILNNDNIQQYDYVKINVYFLFLRTTVLQYFKFGTKKQNKSHRKPISLVEVERE
jgi:hypothetical protein